MDLMTHLSDEDIKNLVKSYTIEEFFPSDQFYKEIHKKNQVILHHTVSNGASAKGDIATWLQSTARVATPDIITEDGILHSLFDRKYWGHAIGCKRAYLKSKGFKDYLHRNKALNRGAIQVELDSLGPVNQHGHSMAYGRRLTTKDIIEYENPYRGFKYYERYSDSALELLYYYLKQVTTEFDIYPCYNEDMWDVSQRALSGESGIWTHTSFRPDKSDCHPQPELIEVLNSF